MPQDYIAGAKLLHALGISHAISTSACDAVFHAIDIACQTGRLVAYDINLRPKLWPLARARAIIHEAVRLADICRPGLDHARALTGMEEPDDIVDFYLKLGPRIVALTLGSNGALVATRERLPPN